MATIYIAPATPGNNDGVFTVWLNGVFLETKSHSFTEYKIFGAGQRDQGLRLNTGQAAFAHANVVPAGTLRFN